MRNFVRGLLLIAAAIPVAFVLSGSAASSSIHGQLAKQAAEGNLRAAQVPVTTPSGTTTRTLPTLSDATVVAAQDALCATTPAAKTCDERAEAADATADPQIDGSGSGGTTTGSGPAHSLGCGSRNAGPKNNFRVNQDCTFRRQAEEEITYNPADPNNLVGGQNDSRVGYNQCGFDWSTNNGKNWGDGIPPFRQHANEPLADGPNTVAGDPGTDHTYDAASDPAVAVDSQGRAYYSCVMFDVFTAASGVYVTQSPVGAEGSFYYNIPAFGRRFIAAEDNNPFIFHDKNFIAADRYPTQLIGPNAGQPNPNKDNVYLTWTVFRFSDNCVGPANPSGYCESPIFGSMSTDHGLHWSKPEEISGDAPAVCSATQFDTTLSASDCNFDQGAQPVALPNGDVEVVFNNGNTGSGNPNSQQLAVHCHPAGDSVSGTASMNCAPPVKVGSDVTVGEPLCDFGRGPEECIPGAYIRTNDFPRITMDNTQNGHLYAVWQDYRNGEYDIQMSQSLDNGLTWQEVGTVNPDRGLDHYFPATDQSPSIGDRNGVSYYRTERVPGENTPANPFAFTPCPNPEGIDDSCNPAFSPTGNSDYVLAGGTGAQTPYDFKVVSQVFPPPDGIQIGFNGDYSGLTINKGTDAHPIWSDTRNVNPYPLNGVVHDEDIFTDNVGLPNGNAQVTTGTIGKR